MGSVRVEEPPRWWLGVSGCPGVPAGWMGGPGQGASRGQSLSRPGAGFCHWASPVVSTRARICDSLRPRGSAVLGAAQGRSLQLLPDELPEPPCVLVAANEASAKEGSWGQGVLGVGQTS